MKFGLAGLSLILLAANCWAITDEKGPVRVIHGQILDVQGNPAAGRHVHLVGVRRACMRGTSTAGWDFTTDASGHFTANVGGFLTVDDQRSSPRPPGWGTYALVVDGDASDAGAVSSQFNVYPPSDPGSTDAAGEWGPTINIPVAGTDMTLQVKKGVTLTGRVWDTSVPSHPLAGIKIYTNNDLGADTHTGRGGEIFKKSTVTDATGAFMISHIYPVKFYAGVGGYYGAREDSDDKNAKGYWLKTQVDGQWKDDVLDVITPGQDGDVIQREIMAAASPSFVFSGRVTTTRGLPVARAEVWLGLSYHPIDNMTYEDNHAGESSKADAQGNYRIVLPTHWVRAAQVSEGNAFDTILSPDPDKTPIVPGRTDFVVQREGDPAAPAVGIPPSTPAPTSSAAPGAPADTADGVAQFMDTFWQACLSNDAAQYGALFSPQVAYCYQDKGLASRDFVQQDRAKLIQVWPTREMEKISQTASVDGAAAQVTLDYHWHYTSAKGSKKGTCLLKLGLVWTGAAWEIASYNETVKRD